MNAVHETLLLRWMENRDAEAFADIVRSRSGMVYATCKRILGNAADAEEVTQECFLKTRGGAYASPVIADGLAACPRDPSSAESHQSRFHQAR